VAGYPAVQILGRALRRPLALLRRASGQRLVRAVVCGALVAVAGCGGDPGEPPPAQRPVFALLSDRLLLKVSATSGRPLGSVQLGPRSPAAEAVGEYLAPSADASSLFVLVPATGRARQGVVEIATATLAVRKRYRLPTGIAFRSVELGPRSGRLYLVGNIDSGRKVGPPVLVVLDPGSQTALDRRVVRPARGRQWYVFDAAVSTDERYMAVSYHGPDATGADWIRLSQRPEICADRTPAWAGCLFEPHGEVDFRGPHLVGTSERSLVEFALDGRRVRSRSPRLRRNHLTRFTLDGRSRRAIVLGSCFYAGGMSVIGLRSGRTKVIGYPGKVCGETASLVAPGLVAVARNRQVVPTGSPSQLDFVDLHTRRIVRRMPTRSEVVALLASSR
jgi:hypothetical protein